MEFRERILSLLDKKKLTGFLVAVLFLCSIALSITGGDKIKYPDERDYHSLALSLKNGEGFVDKKTKEPTAYRPPGWPFVISLFYRITDNALTARIINGFLIAGTAVAFSALVSRIVPAARIFVPLLILCYPVMIYLSSTLFPQTVAMFLFAIVLLLLEGENKSFRKIILAGLVLGTLILTVPYFLLLIPPILFGHFFLRKKEWKETIIKSCVFLSIAAVVVIPWTIRNAYTFKHFVPVSTNSGINLLIGNSENSGPNTGVNVNLSHYKTQVQHLGEAEKNSRFAQYAIDWITTNPKESFSLYLKKLLNHFNFKNKLYVKGESSSLRDLVMFISYYSLLSLTLLRVLLWKKLPLHSTEISLLTIYLFNAFASAIFFTRIRFRIPFDLLLIGIVAIFIGILAERILKKEPINSSSL